MEYDLVLQKHSGAQDAEEEDYVDYAECSRMALHGIYLWKKIVIK